MAGVIPAGRGEDVAVRVHIRVLLLGAELHSCGLLGTLPPRTGDQTRPRLQNCPLELLDAGKNTQISQTLTAACLTYLKTP